MKKNEVEKKLEQFKKEAREERRYEPGLDVHVNINIKKPVNTRLSKHATYVTEDKDGRTIDRIYHDRKGVFYSFRKVFDNKTQKENTQWQILNAKSLPVIPGQKIS